MRYDPPPSASSSPRGGTRGVGEEATSHLAPVVLSQHLLGLEHYRDTSTPRATFSWFISNLTLQKTDSSVVLHRQQPKDEPLAMGVSGITAPLQTIIY